MAVLLFRLQVKAGIELLDQFQNRILVFLEDTVNDLRSGHDSQLAGFKLAHGPHDFTKDFGAYGINALDAAHAAAGWAGPAQAPLQAFGGAAPVPALPNRQRQDRRSTRLNS